MSINSILDPDSKNNKSLNIYCNTITTGSIDPPEPTPINTFLRDHINPKVYFINPSVGGATLTGDNKQLIHRNNKYIKISGEVKFNSDVAGNTDLFLEFDYPLEVKDYIVDTKIFRVGSSSRTITQSPYRDIWLCNDTQYNNSSIILLFNPASGSPIPTPNIELNIAYSISYKVE